MTIEKIMEIRDEKKKTYALFYMDLDFFKPVNERSKGIVNTQFL